MTVNDGTKFAIDCAVALKLYCKEHLGCDENGYIFAFYDNEGQVSCRLVRDMDGEDVLPCDWEV